VDLITFEKIIPELRSAIVGRKAGKIFQIAKFDFAIDFRLPDSSYLFISVEPGDPRIYLIRRRLRDLERASNNLLPFAQFLRKRISNAAIIDLQQIDDERALRILLDAEDDLGNRAVYSLIVQLTGRSANLFLADANDIIIERLRETRDDGQEISTKYSPPDRPNRPTATRSLLSDSFNGSISEYLDSLSIEKKKENGFRTIAAAAESRLKQQTAKLERHRILLEGDLASHGDAEKWKHFGDALLANVATAKRSDRNFVVTDYFDENLAALSVPFENEDSLTETAEKYFRRYTKARNAKSEVTNRLEETDRELKKLAERRIELELAIEARDEDFLASFLTSGRKKTPERSTKKKLSSDGTARSFMSSDGFEILVGKKARDNDVLTFKIAKSLDTWMHAADYPGSHVVIRNPNRKEVPHRTLIEAAELAAFYSQGKTQPKAAVHYTQKKFVNKPKGGAPGLVSLASFKTLLVEPKMPDVSAN
jgi:predicted ribosome quality control (RQC) complex YloA/Tae2 family protein